MGEQVGLQGCSFDVGTSWDRFGPEMTALSSLFEVAFDGGH
jgi:hypothetical protein